MRVYLIENIVLVSGVQHSDSITQILFHPSLSQDTERGSPVRHSKALLFIYFTHSSLYLLVPNAPIIPPAPPFPPLVTLSLFSVPESVSVLEISSFVSYYGFHILEITYDIYLSLSDFHMCYISCFALWFNCSYSFRYD